MDMHVQHLRSKSEQDLNRLLRMIVDVENLHTAMNQEASPDTSRVYSYLIKVIL